ncbi:MAG: glycosyltransferase family 1 protein [Gemmatimonadales bacterium]|jgi:glycosyltransferase involved in cell wall biosynthesis
MNAPSRSIPRRRIGIDISPLDRIAPQSGQYRYVVDLVRGLAALRPHAMFVLIGSRAEPAPEVAGLFVAAGATEGAWRYAQSIPARGRGAVIRDQPRLAWVALRERLDLLHVTHTPVPVLAPCPVVVTVYDLMFELFPEYADIARSRAHRWFRWGVRHRARRVVAISPATAADLRVRWGVESERIDVVPLGTTFVTASATGPGDSGAAWRGDVGGGRPLLASPYNLELRKNLAGLVCAAALLRERHPGLVLALFGRAAVNAEREATFERLLADRGMAAVVRRLGVLPDAALARLYREADAFVFPSLYEGFGLPVLEAMAVGGCVVSHDAPAMAEVLGNAGVLADARDERALAGAIGALLAEPERAAALRAAAVKRAAEFTVERMCRGTLAAYQRALGGAVLT